MEEFPPGVEVVPRLLVFKNSPICIPSIGTIEVVNTAEDAELQVLSIESDDSQFHPAFIKPIMVPPGERTAVQVLYLPRFVGQVEAELTVSTSAGHAVVFMDAFAIKNPYGLHSFVGTKLPTGVLYTRPVIMCVCCACLAHRQQPLPHAFLFLSFSFFFLPILFFVLVFVLLVSRCLSFRVQ